MKHKIMCSCGKLAIECDEASKALQLIVNNGIEKVFEDLDKVRVGEHSYPKNVCFKKTIYNQIKKGCCSTLSKLIPTIPDNHIIGCNLKANANALRNRGYREEAEILDGIASKIK